MPLAPVNTVKTLVTYQLLVGDAETDVTSSYGVLSITVYKECNRISTANIILSDGNAATQEYAASNADDFVPGTKIHIKAGFNFNDETLFKGIITKHTIKSVENSSCLAIECKDAAFVMTLTPKNKIFYNVSESAAIEEILDDNNIDHTVEPTFFEHNELVQYHATDWDFIQSRVQVNNKICLVEDGKITITTPKFIPATHKAAYGDNIYEFEAEIDARNQVDTVEATSWNYSDQELVTKSAENNNLNTTGNLSTGDLASASGNPSVGLFHAGKLPDDILKSWAESKNLYKQLGKICGTVKIDGIHDLLPGSMLKLEGMSNRFNGDVFVSATHHTISQGNWFTTVNFGLSQEQFTETFQVSQLPAVGMLPAINGLQIGVVSALEGDPDGEFRIQVKLPIISAEEEGVWARVLTSYAGENYGVHFLPEIGHEVLVGFLNDDPNQAIILGALFSNTNTSPIEISDDNYEKVIMTQSEIKITLNDENKSIALDTPDGKQIILDDNEAAIILKDENSNTITMNADGISIESGKDIILKATGDILAEGVNIEQKGSAAFKAEGATAELIGSATTTIEGGLVNIN